MQGAYSHVSTELARKALIEDIQKMPLGFDVQLVKKKKPKRTLTQNAALHKFLEMLADALNDAGWDMKRTLRADVDIPWTKQTAKDQLWRPIQDAYLQKKSTADADTDEYRKVYSVLNRHLSEKCGVHVPWPSLRDGDTGSFIR